MLIGGARPDPSSRVPGRYRLSVWHSRPSSAKPSRRHTGPVDALRSPAGERLLAEVAERGTGDRELLGTVAALRSRYDPELVAAAVTQVRLRGRARAKFGADADRMFFTPDGLEQATRAEVAARHAARFAAAGAGRVLDLCCGIGGDLIAFARAGPAVTGGDRGPATAAGAPGHPAAPRPA